MHWIKVFFLVNVCSMIRYEIPNDWNARDFITTTTTFVSTYIAVAFWFIWFYSGLYRAWLEFYIINVKVKKLIGNPEIVVESIFIFIAFFRDFCSPFIWFILYPFFWTFCSLSILWSKMLLWTSKNSHFCRQMMYGFATKFQLFKWTHHTQVAKKHFNSWKWCIILPKKKIYPKL